MHQHTDLHARWQALFPLLPIYERSDGLRCQICADMLETRLVQALKDAYTHVCVHMYTYMRAHVCTSVPFMSLHMHTFLHTYVKCA